MASWRVRANPRFSTEERPKPENAAAPAKLTTNATKSAVLALIVCEFVLLRRLLGCYLRSLRKALPTPYQLGDSGILIIIKLGVVYVSGCFLGSQVHVLSVAALGNDRRVPLVDHVSRVSTAQGNISIPAF